MNKRWVLVLVMLLVCAGLLVWFGLSKNRTAPKQEEAGSLKAANESQPVNVMGVVSEQSKEHAVEPGDSLAKIARQYGTTVDLLKQLNHLQGDLIRVGEKLKVPPGKFDVVVTKADNKLQLRLDGKQVKTYAVSTGKDDSTPTGDFTIVTRLTNPVWYKTGAVIPPGSADNILGTRWLGISSKEHPKGFGIHGTVEPDKIGQAVTAGCVRMRNEDVEEIYALLPEGTAVKIVETTESAQGKS